jgi:hypothetical protein
MAGLLGDMPPAAQDGQQTIWDKLAMTWPARMAQAAWGGVTLPGDVYAGRVTPNDPAYYQRASDLAGGVMSGGSLGAMPGAVGMSGGRLRQLPMAFQDAKALQDQLYAEVSRLGAGLKQYPRTGPLGMIADEIKFSPEYRELKSQYDAAFNRLRNFNEVYTTQFKKEISESRAAKRPDA